MNFQKIVTATLAATILTLSAYAETTTSAPKKKCEFYCGINAGASFNKYDMFGTNSNPSKKSNHVQKKKTGTLLEAILGYDHLFGKFIFGADIGLGYYIGGKMKISNNDLGSTPADLDVLFSHKTIGISVLPKVGYLVAKNLELNINAGVTVDNCKTNYNNSQDTTREHVIVNKSTVKMFPVVGASVKYDFTEKIFGSLAYEYIFKNKVFCSYIMSGWTDTIKTGSQIVKIGVGVRF